MLRKLNENEMMLVSGGGDEVVTTGTIIRPPGSNFDLNAWSIDNLAKTINPGGYTVVGGSVVTDDVADDTPDPTRCDLANQLVDAYSGAGMPAITGITNLGEYGNALDRQRLLDAAIQQRAEVCPLTAPGPH